MTTDFTQATLDTRTQWEDLIRSLISDAGGKYDVAASQTNLFPSPDGLPSLSMYKIRFADLHLPTDVLQLMSEIITSANIVDRCERDGSRNDRTLGAMRQIHKNDKGYLPRIAAPYPPRDKPLSGRSALYEKYVAEKKWNTNDQGGGNTTTGYVEYSAVVPGWTIASVDPRIVFDYVRSMIYYSPIHYSSWDPALKVGGAVVNAPTDKRYPNPWFWITDITATLPVHK